METHAGNTVVLGRMLPPTPRPLRPRIESPTLLEAYGSTSVDLPDFLRDCRLDPSQVATALATLRSLPQHPELRLLVAMLQQAIDDLRWVTPPTARGDDRRKHLRLRDDAIEWILDPRRYHPLAFVPICEMLGLDAGAVRARLLRGVMRAVGA